MLAAFQNVANTLASLETDSETLAFADRASKAARDASADAAARVRLGAIPPRAARGSEQQYLNARLATIRASSARLSDTAALFQAMGSPVAPEASVVQTRCSDDQSERPRNVCCGAAEGADERCASQR